MAANLYWFYDALVLGIALITFYLGSKRGLMRSVVLIALTAASILISWLASEVGSPLIYEKLILPRVKEGLIEASDKTNPLAVVSSAVSSGNYGVEMTDTEVEGILTKAGDFFDNIAAELKTNGAGEENDEIKKGVEASVTHRMLQALVGDIVSPSTMQDILKSVDDSSSRLRSTVDVFLKGNRSDTAAAVEDNLVAPVVKNILSGIIWLVCMFVLIFISRTVANAFKVLNKVPIIGPVNRLMGGAIGLAEGAVIIYLISQLARLICWLTTNSLMFLNTETVDATYVFKYFYYFNVAEFIF